MMPTALVNREERGRVAVLTLNRPGQRNALSRALLAQLRDAVDRLSTDETIRVVVLTGAGPAFCAGMDLKEAVAMDTSGQAEQETIAALQEFGDLIQRLHTLPKPTIAAVNGDALAGGAGLVAACDMAVAAENARIGYPEVQRGLVPAIVMHDLCQQIGDRRVRELLLSGSLINGATAQAWGLVNTVTSAEACLEEAVRIAERLVACAPGALAATKRLLDEARRRPHDLRGAAAVSAAVRISEEAREGIRAFIEKRPPRWAAPGAEEKTK
jgi:methylglutaconyl-CoA hydratase